MLMAVHLLVIGQFHYQEKLALLDTVVIQDYQATVAFPDILELAVIQEFLDTAGQESADTADQDLADIPAYLDIVVTAALVDILVIQVIQESVDILDLVFRALADILV